MANNIDPYNPIFYAQEALIQLELALGMANTVHRGYEMERRSFEKGDSIQIRRPGNFSVQDAPSTAQDVNPEKVTIVLDKWKEVKFGLTDQELAYTGEQIIAEHIRPAAVELATHIDGAVNDLYKDVAYYHNVAATPTQADITGSKKVLFNNGVPLNDPMMNWFEIDGELQDSFEQLSAFSQHQGAAQIGVDTQVNGGLGRKYGLNLYANQNVRTHTPGSITASAPKVQAAVSVGDTSIIIYDTTLTGTILQGDIIEVSGGENLVAGADATASGNQITVVLAEKARLAISADTAVTLVQDAKVENLAYHRNAFALALAPLPETGLDGLGVRVATVQDPITGLALRSRIFYEGNNSKVFVALDVLYGVKTLDGYMACRSRAATV